MKINYLLAGCVLFFATGCQQKNPTIEVKNPTSEGRSEEMVSVEINSIPTEYQDFDNVVLKDDKGEEVPYQITYDKKMIFLTSLEGRATKEYHLEKGTPTQIDNIVQGKVYPGRADDMAWENDVMGFRAYGPALQDQGEQSFGYDLFVKHKSDTPMLDTLYKRELDHETRNYLKSIKETDPEKSLELWKSISYHYDRGQGLDCYAVGPTLGAGVTALLENDSIIYPYCYKEFEALDNGPLRFTGKLTFRPTDLNGENVVEERIITLDKGSQLNRTQITYKGLSQPHMIASGLVLHDTLQRFEISKDQRFVSYVDPTVSKDKINGEIYVGMVFPKKATEVKTLPFSKEKSEKINAYGHLLVINEYQPNQPFVYYWGAGWSKSSIPSEKDWVEYLQNFENKMDHPLEVSVR